MAVSIVSTGMLVAVLTGCDHAPDPYWNPHAPWSPSLPQDFGIRVTDGHLDLWAGSRCAGVLRLRATFLSPGGHYYEWESVDLDGGELEYVRFGEPVPGLTPIRTPEPGFDWREMGKLSVTVFLKGGEGMAAGSDLPEVFENSDKYPEDTYYFQHGGWLDAAGVAAEDGKSFLTLCTPDPAEE